MKQIFIFSDLYLPTFPFLEVPLYQNLKDRGLDVKYVLQAGDIRLTLPHLKKIYEPITTIVKKPKNILAEMDKKDLLVCRFAYKDVAGSLIAKARKKRVIVLDPAAVDIAFRETGAQYMTVKSPWMKRRVIKKFPKRKKYIYTTGTLHFDMAWGLGDINKVKFMESYGLNPNKKLAILCKSSAGEVGHQKGIDAEYKQIVNIVRKKCPEWEVLVKFHPVDHLSEYAPMPGVMNKNLHYKHRPSWEILFPGGVNILKPEEGYLGFKCADVILNVRSSIGMESVLFPTPLLNINSHKYLINWPKSSNPSIMKFIKMESLSRALNNHEYSVDIGACRKHVLEYCDPVGDGKAYKRIAKIIENLIQ